MRSASSWCWSSCSSRAGAPSRWCTSRLLRDRVYAAGNLTTLLSTVGLMGFLFFFNLYAQSDVTFDYSAVAASLVLLPYGVSLFVTSLVAGRLGDRIGYPIPVGGGLVLLTIGAILFATIDDVTALSDLWLPLVLCGVGLGACFATASAAAMAVVPPEESGEAAGTLNISRYIGGAVGRRDRRRAVHRAGAVDA